MKASLRALAFCFLACFSKAAEPTLKLDLGSGVGLDLVLIPAGSFTQGSPANEAGRAADEPQRQVTISKEYYLGRTAVTRAQWERFIAETNYKTEAEGGTSGGYGWTGSMLEQRKEFTWRNPGFPQTPEHPVCLVTFPDAQAFCAWLEKKSGRKVSLPTEAQWEYACRAGTPGPWRGLDAFSTSWHKDNAGNGTRPANAKTPNPWGLVIGGNVSEWCLDWYGPYPEGAATDPLQQNQNLSDKPRRILRGGSWIRGASNTRSGARYRADPRSRNADIGFRILCATEAPAPAKVTPPITPPVAPKPSVEVESSGPRQTPTETMPAPHHEPAPQGGSSLGAALFKGLVCFFIPVGLVFAIVFGIVRRKNNAASAGNPADRFLHPTPPPRPFAATPIRKGDDGFWISGDWPEGTALKLRYMVAGVAMVQEILYRPGAEGQFVYTGSEPDSISVVAGDDPSNTVEPGGLFGFPSMPMVQHRDRDDDDDDRRRSVPPTRPSAY